MFWVYIPCLLFIIFAVMYIVCFDVRCSFFLYYIIPDRLKYIVCSFVYNKTNSSNKFSKQLSINLMSSIREDKGTMSLRNLDLFAAVACVVYLLH